jgi:Cys-rich repeat protein
MSWKPKLYFGIVVVLVFVLIYYYNPYRGKCKTDADCKPGQMCRDKKCAARPAPAPGCQADAQCPSGQKCLGGKCVAPKPRQGVTDCGYPGSPHGWFDVQGQGVPNDYCRFVGDPPNIQLQCALAGAASQYSAPYDPTKFSWADCVNSGPAESCGGAQHANGCPRK